MYLIIPDAQVRGIERDSWGELCCDDGVSYPLEMQMELSGRIIKDIGLVRNWRVMEWMTLQLTKEVI